MLRPVPALSLGLLFLLAAPARAQDGEGIAGIRRPERLTIGVAHEFLGQLSPDGKELYYLSNRNIVREIYRQDMDVGRASLLFDEGADIAWLRVSPDGRRLLYISFRDDASGQLCVRDLPAGRRRCLSDGGSAVEAQWMGTGQIALLSRSSLQGDLRLLQVTVADRLSARPLLQRNLTNPAISPDGRWLVYVPVERYVQRVGPGFAALAAPRLEAVRLDAPGHPGPPQPLVLDLPGRSGQPAFSPDGRSLYVVQFLNDSNHDGVIDAGDNGVLFRVPFAGGRDDAPALSGQASPEQITDSQWNCQYPSPSARLLITTCALGQDLDVYSLPPDGVVPGHWSVDRLQQEIDLSSRPLEQQLLYRHLLQQQTDAAARHRTMMRLCYLHLWADEFDAAEFYARKLGKTSGPDVVGLLPVLLAHIAHHRAVRARESGRLGVGFAEESRARLAALDAGGPGGPSVRALRHIVRSEIQDALGDKQAARRELEAAVLKDVTLPTVLEAFYRRADALYRQLDDAGALWARLVPLSGHPALHPDQRLHYARAAVRALTRGLPLDRAEDLLARRRAAVAPGSELAFALELAQAVLRIRGDTPPAAVRDSLYALYRRQTELARRRAVMLDAVQRASEVDADDVIEDLVQFYVDDVPKGTRERRRAEVLYRRFMEGRAYRELAAGQLAEARDDFVRSARTTGSFEGHVGYIDLRLREGATPEQLEAEFEQRGTHYSEAVARFVRAYLLSLKLPRLEGRQHTQMAERVIALLREAWPKLKGEPTVRALLGAVLHEQFLRTGDHALAQRADTHYLVALELSRRGPRYRAMLLEQLGLLQAQVGNYRIALGHLEEREKIPFVHDAAALAHQLLKARTLQHLDHKEDAAMAAEAALSLCEHTPALSGYRVLALDRAALYNLSAGRFGRSLQLYDEELPLLGTKGPEAERNHLVVRLARAAAALGAQKPRLALSDLVALGGQLADPGRRLRDELHWQHTPADEVLRSYRLLVSGLRARAHRALGELDQAARVLEERRGLLEQRLKLTGLDEHLRMLALVEAQLAEVADERRDAAGAGRWLSGALGHADAFLRRAGIPVDADELDLLWFAAELRLSGEGGLGPAVPALLQAAHQRMVQGNDPAWRSYRRLLEIYIALTSAGGP